MPVYTVLINTALLVEAKNEVEALAEARESVISDGSMQNVQIMAGDHYQQFQVQAEHHHEETT